MKPFQKFSGTAYPIDRANVDTDAIIPKQFLKRITRTGYEPFLFYDWRYLEGTTCDFDKEKCDFTLTKVVLNEDFALNKDEYKGSNIILSRNNFGCGSSREHAVWAITGLGIKAVIAPKEGDIPGFADIFNNNAYKNELLPIELSEQEVDELFELVKNDAKTTFSVDLENQSLSVSGNGQEKQYSFPIDSEIKNRLLKGLDDIGITLQDDAVISQYEQDNPQSI